MAPQTYALKESLKEQRLSDLPPRAELMQVPFFPQDDYFCGPSALAMVLNAAGVKASPEELVDQVYLPGRKGSLQVEMLAAARRHGLIAYELEPVITDLLREIAAGTPAIVLENYGFSWYPVWHYSVVVGYDLPELEVIRRSGKRPRITTPLTIFEKIWKHESYWAMVAVPADRVPATATETRYATAVVALENSGQTKTAFTAYNTLLKRWPASLAGQMGRGNTAYALHDLETAESAFRQASRDHPDSAAAFNNFAQVLSDRGKLSEAVAAAETAVSLGGPLQSATQATLDEIRKKQAAAAQEAKAREETRVVVPVKVPAPEPPRKSRKKRAP